MGKSANEVEHRQKTVVESHSRFFNPPDREEDSSADQEIALHKARIAGKRREMSATIDGIQEKLDPQRIKNQVTASVREATVGRAQDMFNTTRYGLMDRVRANPLPAAMVAIGLGWLFTRQPDESAYRPYSYDDGRADQLRSRLDDLRSTAQSRADDLRSTAQARAEDLRSTAQAHVDDVTGRAQDTVAQMQDRASAAGEQARYQASRARGSFEQLLEDNPLAVGAIALALGAAVGLAAPSTPKENEMFGEARDRLMDRAQSTARDAMQKAQRVADRAASTVQEEVRTQGLV